MLERRRWSRLRPVVAARRGLLKRMARWGSGDRFLAAIEAIRAQEPGATFRSSFIVGFPGETEPDHGALLTFLDDAQLDWAGFFLLRGGGNARSHARRPRRSRADGRAPARVRGAPGRDHPGRRDALVLAEAPSRCSSMRWTTARWSAAPTKAPEIDGVVHVESDAGEVSVAAGDLVLAAPPARSAPTSTRRPRPAGRDERHAPPVPVRSRRSARRPTSSPSCGCCSRSRC